VVVRRNSANWRQCSSLFGNRAAEGGKLAANGGIERQSEIRNRLITLVDKAKSAPLPADSIYRMVSREFEAIAEARQNRVAWHEIADACGFSGKENRLRDAFSKERRRREKKGGLKPTAQQARLAQKIENGKQDEKPAGVMLLDNKKSSGACEIFKSFRSID